MKYTVRFDRTIFYNPVNKYCVATFKTADTSVPGEARSSYHYRDHLIRFTAAGYDLPRTSAVEVTLEGQWQTGKYGCQFQVEQWKEIIPQTTEGIRTYLASGLLKNIGGKTADAIVERFGMDALTVIETQPERLLEIRGITGERLEEIKASYAESRVMRDIITLLAPFKVTPKAAQKIYQYFGPRCLDILRDDPFQLCRVPGFGFKTVDAILQKNGIPLDDPRRIRGAMLYALEESRSKDGHLFLEQEELTDRAYTLLNAAAPLVELRVSKETIKAQYQELALRGLVVSNRERAYLPKTFALEDETARKVSEMLTRRCAVRDIAPLLRQVRQQLGLILSTRQEQAVMMAFRHDLSIITGGPGTGKTTVLKVVLAIYQKLYPKNGILLTAPTGRASRRMAESTGLPTAKTLHKALKLMAGDDEKDRDQEEQRGTLNAGLIIVDETSMVDMWLANQFFSRVGPDTKVLLVGDADQLPSVGAGSVFRELISCGLIPVTVLDEIFRQAKGSRIAHNAKFINESRTDLLYGEDFRFVRCQTQELAAEQIKSFYLQEIAENGIENVQILSPYRSEGAASARQLNELIREEVNPNDGSRRELKVGDRVFREGDRVMQTRNKDEISNGDMGFIRAILPQDTGGGKVVIEFSENRIAEYGAEGMESIELAYAVTVHKSQGSEYDVVIIPILRAHTILLNRNLVYTAITRAKRCVILVGQKDVLFMAVHRHKIDQRNTVLGERIRLYYKAFTRGADASGVHDELKKAV